MAKQVKCVRGKRVAKKQPRRYEAADIVLFNTPYTVVTKTGMITEVCGEHNYMIETEAGEQMYVFATEILGYSPANFGR